MSNNPRTPPSDLKSEAIPAEDAAVHSAIPGVRSKMNAPLIHPHPMAEASESPMLPCNTAEPPGPKPPKVKFFNKKVR